jgi:hypothetical protein
MKKLFVLFMLVSSLNANAYDDLATGDDLAASAYAVLSGYFLTTTVVAIQREVIFNDGVEFIFDYEIDPASATPSPFLKEQLHLAADKYSLVLTSVEDEYELTKEIIRLAYEM